MPYPLAQDESAKICLEHENRGQWQQADLVNQWLAGAFTTLEELLSENVPAIRRHFLRRLSKKP